MLASNKHFMQNTRKYLQKWKIRQQERKPMSAMSRFGRCRRPPRGALVAGWQIPRRRTCFVTKHFLETNSDRQNAIFFV